MESPPRPHEPGWQAWAEAQTIAGLRAELTRRISNRPPVPPLDPIQIVGDPSPIELDEPVIRLVPPLPQASAG